MSILLRTLVFVFETLNFKDRRKFILIGILLFMNSILELVGLGVLLPIFSVLLKPELLGTNKFANLVADIICITDPKLFVVVLSLFFFFVIVVKNLISLWIIKKFSFFSFELGKRYSLLIFEYYQFLGWSFITSQNSNILVRNMKTAPNNFAQYQVLGVLNILNELIILMLILFYLVINDAFVLMILFCSVVPIFSFFYFKVKNASTKLGSVKNTIEPNTYKLFYQSVFGFIDYLLSNSQLNAKKRISIELDQLVEVDVKTNYYNVAPTKVIEVSLMLSIIIIVIYGTYFLPNSSDMMGLLVTVGIAGYRLAPSINRIMIALNSMNQSIWVFDVFDMLKYSDMSSAINCRKESFSFCKNITLTNLTLKYSVDQEYIFKDFNLTISKGEIIGLIGASGSGKTTLIKILLGFIKPQSGKYTIDGIEFEDIDVRSFYNSVGYVQQQTFLIDATIAENIAFGMDADEIDYSRVEMVLAKVSLGEFVKGLPLGIHTNIGEDGSRISGGQRQRIGIARALYFNCEILILDEATSALDLQTESEITQSIFELASNELTVIIIAHRMSAMKICNRIIEINSESRPVILTG